MEDGISASKDNFGDNVLRIPFKTTSEVSKHTWTLCVGTPFVANHLTNPFFVWFWQEQSMDVEEELDDIGDIMHYDITRRRFNVEMRFGHCFG